MTWRSIPILCYHNTSVPDGHTPEQLAQHLDCIRDMGFKTLGARDIVGIVAKKRPLDFPAVGITFDDGHLSNWLYALPLLKERGMRASFFVCTDFIGNGPVRSQSLAPNMLGAGESFFQATVNNNLEQFMNQAELRSLVQDHGMDVLPHSAGHECSFIRKKPVAATKENWCSHRLYGRDVSGEDMPCFKGGSAYARPGWLPRRENGRILWYARDELERYRFCLADFQRSKNELAAILDQKMDIFCWPWGEFDPVSEKALRDAGFRAAFTLQRGRVGPGTDAFRMGRICVSPRKSLSWLKSRLFLLRCGPFAALTRKKMKLSDANAG
ncbi:MAG: polysaccharide deacetylase family protein [Desulfovibrionales bacterium]